MGAGSAANERFELSAEFAGEIFQFTCVESMCILGVQLDGEGRTQTSIEHRLRIAESILEAFKVIRLPRFHLTAITSLGCCSMCHGNIWFRHLAPQ